MTDLVKCLQIENDSFRRLHKDNINYQDALQARNKNLQREIELLHNDLKAFQAMKDELAKVKEHLERITSLRVGD